MKEKPEKEREITESTATQFVPVTDSSGNKYYCLVSDLRDPDSLTEEEKQRCIPDTKE